MSTLKEDDDIQVNEGKLEDERVEVELTEDEDRKLSADGHEEDGDDREAIRERRRKEKVERKERREKAIGRDKLELDFLRQRNDDLERRLSAQETRSHQSDVNLVDQRLQEAINEAQMAEKVIAKAVEAGNGEDVAQALRYRDQALARAQQINAQRQQLANQPLAKPAETFVDKKAMAYAQEFIEDNKWYDPAGNDEDSAIVLAIDNSLLNEGFKPGDEDYWDELRDRVKRRLPEKFKEDRRPKGGPAVGSGREHAPTSTRREVYISPERKQALVDAGVWDDPVLRQRYIKKYMEYDRDNRA